MRPLLAVLPVLAVLSAAPAASQQLDAERGAAIDALFGGFGRDTPGAAVAVVRGDALVFTRGYGMANLEHRIPITPATVFDIASLSKQFTGLAVAMLVEEGAIDLTADIRTYLPDLPDFGHIVTVEHLVHHTSGIRDWPGTLAAAGWRMDDVISFEQIMTMARHQRDLNFAPGAEHLYSNTGYNILAAIVEAASGQSFRTWTEERLFRPLGMEHTHFQDDHAELIQHRAYGYSRDRNAFTAVPNGLTAYGSSSLFTTAEDMAKWAANLFVARVGGRAAVDLMHTRGTLNDGDSIAYAFGIGIGQYRGLTRAQHGGSWAGFRTYSLYFPDEQVAVIVLANVSAFNPSRRAHAIADLVLADRLAPAEERDRPAAATLPEVAVASTLLNEYVGTYKLGPGWLLTVTRNGDRLMVQGTGEQRLQSKAVSDTEFWVQAYGASVHFQRGTDGIVARIAFRDIEAPRVDPFTPTSAQLAQYAGRYASSELGTFYDVVVEGVELVAYHRRHGRITLSPLLRDEFLGGTWFLRQVQFERDADGNVTEMGIGSGRARNLRFVRN